MHQSWSTVNALLTIINVAISGMVGFLLCLVLFYLSPGLLGDVLLSCISAINSHGKARYISRIITR